MMCMFMTNMICLNTNLNLGMQLDFRSSVEHLKKVELDK